ncbi:site-specific integrase [Listeria innocua]|uniref:tyrosine-type recombinase/integrase n=1 Tax=Listeria innocua TaxID=1642 RepID=UPI0016252BAC|nr:site-specific integrase [Listeria innocua]MBC2135334.1 site-specific integrase [Listeria innocua]
MKKYKCVYTDKKGRIYYKLTLGKDKVTNKPIQVKSYKDEYGKSFKTLEDAYAATLIVKAEFIKNQNQRTDECQTFSNYIDKVYQPYYSRTVQDSTAYNAKSHFKLMKDYFNNKPLNKITRVDCSDFCLFLLDKFPGKDPSPTASNYAGAVWVRFRAALTHAFDMNIIHVQPSAGLRSPAKEKIKTPYWTFEDFKTAITSFDMSDFHQQWHATIIWLYYFTGVRVSEGTALTWNDVDLDKAEIIINKTFSQDSDGKQTLHEHTKTHAGMRTIDLDTQTVEILRRWKSIQPNASAKGYVIGKSGTVAVSKSTISRLLKTICTKNNVTCITGKSLRKSHTSYLINELNESNQKYVQQRLGHEKIQTTLDYYAAFDANDDARKLKRHNMDKQLSKSGLQLFETDKKSLKSTKKSTIIELVS